MTPVDEEETLVGKQSRNRLRCNSSEEDFSLEPEEISVRDSIEGIVDSREQETSAAQEHPKSRRLLNISRTWANLEIPKRTELFEMSNGDHRAVVPSYDDNMMDSPLKDGYEMEEEATALEQDSVVPKEKTDEHNLDNEVEDIHDESILKRVNSRKGMNSYQLGKQLSCKWTTGAGPRIGCLRDYPLELQYQALEHVKLSPRSASYSKLYISSGSTSSLSQKVSTPAGASEAMRTLSLPVLKKGNLLRRRIHSKYNSPHCSKHSIARLEYIPG